MAKFVFNPETLEYQKFEVSRKRRFHNFIKFTSLMVVFFVVVFYVGNDLVKSPKLNKLESISQQLKYEIKSVNNQLERYSEELDRVSYNDDHLYRVYFESEAIPSTKRGAGTGGVDRYGEYKNNPNGELLTETFSHLDEVTRKLVVQSKSFDEVIEFAKNKEARMAARPAIQPVRLKDLTRFGSSYGMRFHPILKRMRMHEGIDLTAPKGTKIYATADGEVLQAAYTTGGYGRKILIDHGYGYKTVYGHCSKLLVEKGQKVKRGDLIGLVGNTGLSKGDHLHYEVRINNRPVDPINYYANDLSTEEYDQMILLLSEADPSFDIN